MARISPVHYIAPSAISISPNANGSQRDLAVYVVKGAKMKVFCPRAGINYDDNSYQEWTFSGRNRRLADTDGATPYTIYARLAKYGDKTGYLVFAPKQSDGQGWKDKYPYLTDNSINGFSTGTAGQPIGDYYYVRLGDVSAVVDGQRTIELDTGILGTDQFNDEWALNPDTLPLRIELGCTINDEDAGPTPYVFWGQQLVLTATLTEGWSGTDIQRFDHWEITRNSGDAAADAQWQAGAEFARTGCIALSHARGIGDDFNGAVSSTFTIVAMGHSEGSDSSDSSSSSSSGATGLVALKTATINIHAETVEKYELALSANIVGYNPQTNTFDPENITVRIRATDQRGNVFELTKGQFDNAGIVAEYAAVGSSAWTPIAFSGASTAVATASLATATTFADEQSINVRLVRNAATDSSNSDSSSSGESEAVLLMQQTIAFVRDGEDSKEREWIFYRSTEAITFGTQEHPYPANISGGQVNPTGAAAGSDTNKNQDGWVPEGWWDEMRGTDATNRYEYGSYRDYIHDGDSSSSGGGGGHWGPFSEPKIWSHYGKDGVSYIIDTFDGSGSGYGVESINIPSDEHSFDLYLSIRFLREIDGVRTAFACYSQVYARNTQGALTLLFNKTSAKASSYSFSRAGTGALTDDIKAIVIYASESPSSLTTNFLFMKEIPVIKDGDTGEAGEDGKDAHEVNPNILLRSIFDRGIDFVLEAWTRTDAHVAIDTSSDTIVDGRRSLRMNASSLSTYLDFLQDVYGRIRPSTWYTLSFNYFATNNFNTFLWGGSSTSGIVDRNAGYYIDGVFNSGDLGIDGYHQWPAEWTGEKHSISFKTSDSFGTTSAYILFRCLQGGQLAICMPKLEEGKVATAYMAHEDDLKGDSITGATGKMCYIAGEYRADVEYRSDSTSTVAVEIAGSGNTTELYILKAATNWPGGTSASAVPPKDAGGHVNTDYWDVALSQYNLIRTKYLFTDFANLGSFIVSGDWQLSQYGTLKWYSNGAAQTTEINANNYDSPTFGSKVPYMWFKGSDPTGTATPTSDTSTWRFIPTWAVDGLTGKTYQNDAYIRGVVYATGGVFSGFVKKSKTDITPSNISQYTTIAGNYTVLDVEKCGTFVEMTAGVTGYLSLPLLCWGFANSYTSEQKDNIRSFVGSKLLIYNNSGSNMNIVNKIYGSFQVSSFTLSNGCCVELECILTVDDDGSLNEMIYWQEGAVAVIV